MPSLLRTSLLCIAATAALAGTALAGNGNGNGNKVEVCHVTGNGSVNVLNVSANALASHLAHGDYAPIDWYLDLDGDGFGDVLDSTSCFQPGGTSSTPGDCDDGDASVNPGAAEVCDGIDHNCDGQVDEGFDADGDGFTNCDGDCDDADPSINPGVTELCGDGIDDNCDGQVDEGCGPCDTVISNTCTINMATGAATCDMGNPVSTVSTVNGLALRADMTNWTAMVASFDVDLPDNVNSLDHWALNIGNSPSNNGWGGDGSQFANDSEIQLWRNGVQVLSNDYGLNATGNVFLPGVSPATDLAGDFVEATVCDGYFSWENDAGFTETISPYLFQIDGDEADFQAGGSNDSILWIGINRTVGTPYRSGSGVQNMTLTFWD